jgi:uncharacterized damage-inducible protein DinB
MPKTLLALLEEQLRLSFEGPAWHGPSVREAVDGVSATDAASRPIANAHSIWELVLHLAGTYGLVLRRMRGDTNQLSLVDDWPAIPEATEAAWAAARDELRAINARLRAEVLEFPEHRLHEPLIPKPSYTAFTQFIGLTQHDLYHAGQIVLLKKALARNAN